MKATTRTKYGGPEVLEIKNLEIPSPKNNEVLIRVHATTVNRTDCGILTGKPYLIRAFTGLFKPSSLVPGTDFAGEIISLGKSVSTFKVGDRVWGLNDEGLASQAQYMTMNVKKAITLIPDNFSYSEAVACAEGSHYAYNFINKLKLRKGDKILVNGATGAIGSAAVQLLKYMEVYVTAVGNTKNLALIKSLGADKIFNYETEDFTSDEVRYDYVFDAVGKSSFGACNHLLKDGGIYVSSELGPGNENLYLPLTTLFKGKKRVVFPIPRDCKASIEFVSKLMKGGKFKAVIDRTYPLEDVHEAYHYVASGQKTGNVIISYV